MTASRLLLWKYSDKHATIDEKHLLMTTNPLPAAVHATSQPKIGLRAWMEAVLVECERVEVGFEPDPVHDLRVALRRCRSMADDLMAMDSDSSWKRMKKAGKKVFQSLGGLRDMQVMQQWIQKLANADDPIALALRAHMREREHECKQEATKALQQFDRKQWKQWSRSLPRRSSRLRPGSIVFKHLALEKWTAAYDLHKRALHSRSPSAFHNLRIGIKRLLYTVENFLPSEHAAWGADLKDLQDCLGDVHDLDVLWNTALEISAFPNVESRLHWRQLVIEKRSTRLERYREKMVGKHSLWRVWRAELPSGPQLRVAAVARLRTWASYLDPDFQHSQRVAQLALSLFDGLNHAGLIGPNGDPDSRAVLQAAALVQDIGKSKGYKAHHKSSFRMIRNLTQPLGWTARETQLLAVVARYHRGALPASNRKSMQMLTLPDRHLAQLLAGVLRLANSLERRDAAVPKLQVAADDRVIVIHAASYSPLDRSAEEVAAARHLLEIVLRRPVIVRPLRSPGSTRASRTLSLTRRS